MNGGGVGFAPSASRALREDVSAACRALSIPAVSLRAGSIGNACPRLIVSTLRAGERAIPRDTLDVSDEAGEGACVLLVAEERLVRPTVTLQGGRVTLLGGPASPERLRGVLRMLAKPPAVPARNETLTASAWVASSLDPRALLVDDAVVAAVVELEALEDQEPLDPQTVTDAREALSAPGGESRVAEVGWTLDGRAGLVLYRAAARELVVFWPRPDRGVWVCSPVRLPGAADLATAAAGSPDRVVRLAAASGDVAVAFSAPDIDPAAMQRAAVDGAAAIVERLGMGTPGFVMEVR